MVVSPGPPAVIMRGPRRKVVGHLAGVGATNARAAVTYLPTHRFERKALTDLQRRGVVSPCRRRPLLVWMKPKRRIAAGHPHPALQ
jgi:hypothetical protein